MAKRNIITSTLMVLITATIIFFIIFFFAPTASVQFLGVGFRLDANDISNYDSVNLIIKEAKSLKTFTDEELEVLKDLLSTNSVVSDITDGRKITKDEAKQIAAFYSAGNGRVELDAYVKARQLYTSADDFANKSKDAIVNFGSSLKNILGN